MNQQSQGQPGQQGTAQQGAGQAPHGTGPSGRPEAHSAAPTFMKQQGVRNEAVAGPFTVRDLTVFAATLVLFVASLIPMFAVRYNLWNLGSLFFLGLGVVLPLIVAALFAARRLAPDTKVRIGSLSVDQFGSVVASFAVGFFFLSVAGAYTPSLLVALIGSLVLLAATVLARYIPFFAGDFLDRAEVPAHIMARDSAVPVRKPKAPKEPKPAAAATGAAAVPGAASAGVSASHGAASHTSPSHGATAVGQPGRGGTPTVTAGAGGVAGAGAAGAAGAGAAPATGGWPAANAASSAAASPEMGQAAVVPSPQTGGAAAQTGARPSAKAAGAGAQPATSAAKQTPVDEATAPAAGAGAAGAKAPAAEAPAVGVPAAEAPAVGAAGEAPAAEAPVAEGKSNAAARQAAEEAARAASATPATAVHPRVDMPEQTRSQEPIGATVDPASRPEESEQEPVHEAFWFAVAQHRTAVDERTGAPLFGIEPGGWVLALEDRGDEFLVQHTDGRVGVLRDLSNIERG
ncbi:hypothetical protein ARGLB_008_01450 [Arthrobacter globiformis NBRC 12137]|uniref:Uncharacterized protein n=1 Tax=Arthrobacter globiformis (strain ATCC 8010 / DSM 20124 / JCM 1332 / NBRC 12137 / NCIMB 8907 / NRRL B-2979 / 168) TaxID=1077972 RepID=H0QH21_ARTG1|nr:hypothetical protein [Arthrobacter globiformis]GAB12122.1 hypothetical protein ARGLB_008_01450 [Arthrobacter globiformis NBRC 12137]